MLRFGVLCTIGLILWPLPRDPQQRFEAGVDLVVADFLAVTKNGDPVLDMGMRDLRLSIDGKTRPVASVQLVQVSNAALTQPLRNPNEPEAARTPVLESGKPPEARSVFLIFDEDSMRPSDERTVVEGAVKFVASLSERDRVAVIALPGGRLDAELTADREATRRALQQIRGRLPPPPPPIGQERVLRACEDHRRSTQTLKQLAEFLTGIRAHDGLKTVVLTSSGMQPQGVETSPANALGCAMLTVDPAAFVQVGTLAAASRAQFYVIQPHSFAVAAGDGRGEPGFYGYRDVHAYFDDQLRGIEDVAGVTGGELFRVSGQADAIFAKVARQSSSYYLLGFAPAPGEADGKRHKIVLTTPRKDVTIRARPAFTISR